MESGGDAASLAGGTAVDEPEPQAATLRNNTKAVDRSRARASGSMY
jgi:hypothetical protein